MDDDSVDDNFVGLGKEYKSNLGLILRLRELPGNH